MYRAAGYLQGNAGTVGDYVNLEQFRSFPGFGLGATATPAPSAPYERVLMLAAQLAASSPTEARLAAVVGALGTYTPAQIGMAEVTGCQLVREIRQGKDPLTAVREAVAYLEKVITSPAKELKTQLGVIAALDPSRTANFEATALGLLLKGFAAPTSADKTRAKSALAAAIAAVRNKTMSVGRAAQVAFEKTQPTVYGTKQKLVLTPGYQCAYGMTPAQQAEAAKIAAILAAREEAVRQQQQAAQPPVIAAQPPVLTQTATEQGTVLAPALPPASVADMTLEQLLAQPTGPAPAPATPTTTQEVWYPAQLPDGSWSSSQATPMPTQPTVTVEENWGYPSDSLPALPPELALPGTPAVWQPPDQVVLDVPAEPPPLKKFPVVPVAVATGGVVAAILLYRKFGQKK